MTRHIEIDGEQWEVRKGQREPGRSVELLFLPALVDRGPGVPAPAPRHLEDSPLDWAEYSEEMLIELWESAEPYPDAP